MPKSTQLAHHIAKEIGEEKVTIYDIPQMKIFPCE
jgi:predicted Zn-dependent protease